MTRQKNNLMMPAMVLLTALSLSACSSVKRELGVDRNSPDEFMVVKQAPLSLPPDYTLRPPQDGAEAKASHPAGGTAREALLGRPAAPAIAGSAEKALLSKLGTEEADPAIRTKIDEENGYIAITNRTVAQKLIFWDDEKPASPDNMPSSVVNPEAEARRLEKTKADGKPVTGETVPVIEKKKNTLEKIF